MSVEVSALVNDNGEGSRLCEYNFMVAEIVLMGDVRMSKKHL